MVEMSEMSCEHLICARCSGPVVEGRCPACRSARAEIHHSWPLNVPPLVVAAVVLLLTLLIVLKLH